MTKKIAFIIVTMMCFIGIYINGMSDRWNGVIYLFLGYVVFILVSLYEIGRIEIEKEENENRNNRE
jgi:Ca2+/Na+ antiporter